MNSFGGSIIALHDSQARTIQFNAVFSNPDMTSKGVLWLANVRDSFGEIDPVRTEMISIGLNNGLLSYSPNLEGYYYIYVTVQRYTEANNMRGQIEFAFRLDDVTG